MVSAIFKMSKFIDDILIYCRLTFNNIKQSYSTKSLINRDNCFIIHFNSSILIRF
jgi:hypothetical protein